MGFRFKNELEIGEMIHVSQHWTGPLRADFLAIPEIAPLLPRVEEDLAALLSVTMGSPAEAQVRSFMTLSTKLDGEHDHLQRGLSFLAFATREILLGLDPPDLALAEQIDDAITRLQPEGLQIISRSYEAESGNALQMVTLADAELAPVLSQIPAIQGLTALDIVHRIGTVGAALGDVERKRSAAEVVAAEERIAPAEIKRRMRDWAETLGTVLSALSRTKAPAETVAKIRKVVEDVAETARQRHLARLNAEKKKGEEPKPEEKDPKAGEAKPADPKPPTG